MYQFWKGVNVQQKILLFFKNKKTIRNNGWLGQFSSEKLFKPLNTKARLAMLSERKSRVKDPDHNLFRCF